MPKQDPANVPYYGWPGPPQAEPVPAEIRNGHEVWCTRHGVRIARNLAGEWECYRGKHRVVLPEF
jgi:hypothetical protein